LPTHSSQRSQVLLHAVLGVHTGHLVGLPMSAYVQVDAIVTCAIPPSGPKTSQQPKQSHPFGTRGLQNFTQAAVT
jgi:hypothetical protein